MNIEQWTSGPLAQRSSMRLKFTLKVKGRITASGSFIIFSHTENERRNVNKSLSVVWLPNLNHVTCDFGAQDPLVHCSMFITVIL